MPPLRKQHPEKRSKTVARFQINFDQGTLDLIENLRGAYPEHRRESVTTAEIIRDTLGFVHWLTTMTVDGTSLALVNEQGVATRITPILR